MIRPDPPQEVLFGLHPVLEAIEAGTRRIDRIFVSREGGGRNLGRLLRAARDASIPVTHLPKDALARKVGARGVHQGVAAVVSSAEYADAESVCRGAAERSQGLLLVLDGVEDPRNLGAILRTAAGVGAHGVLLGTEKAVGLTPVVAKTSAGALERVPIAREPHLRRRIESLRAQGFRVIALDPRGATAWDAESYGGRVVVVVGGEGRGIRRGLLEVSDARVALPLVSGIDSLNVSVAVGALLFEIVRQRRSGEKKGSPVRNPGANP